jgi:hypothetical protein
MNESARVFVAIHTPWCQSPLYMYNDRHDQFREFTSRSHAYPVNFLAHEDVALKAYFESRCRYLGRLPQETAFNRIGEALPTIIHGGQVIGTWAWDRRNMTVNSSVIRGYASSDLSKEVRHEARMLSETLRLRWV